MRNRPALAAKHLLSGHKTSSPLNAELNAVTLLYLTMIEKSPLASQDFDAKIVHP